MAGLTRAGIEFLGRFRVMSHPPGRTHGEYIRRWVELKFAWEPITPHFALMLTVFLGGSRQSFCVGRSRRIPSIMGLALKSPFKERTQIKEIPLFLHPDGKTVGVQSIGIDGVAGLTRAGIAFLDRFRGLSHPLTPLIPSGMFHGLAPGKPPVAVQPGD